MARFDEVSDDLLDGKKVRSQSYGTIFKHLELINGGVYLVDRFDKLNPWNATHDIVKTDWAVVDDDTLKEFDETSQIKEFSKLTIAQLTIKATELGVEITGQPNKAKLIELIISKLGGEDNAKDE